MSLVDVIGWSATLVGALLGLPQLLRLIRTHSVDGLSLLAWRAVLTLNIAWLGHGLHIGQPPQVVTNLVALSLTLPLVILLARASGRSLPLVLAPSLAAAALIITVDLTLGSLTFGIAAIIPGILANAGQSVELVRSPLVSGVSPMFLLLACLNQCLWLTWALLVPDPGTIFAGDAHPDDDVVQPDLVRPTQARGARALYPARGCGCLAVGRTRARRTLTHPAGRTPVRAIAARGAAAGRH